MFAYRFIDNINYSVYLSTLKSFNGHYIHYLLKLSVQSMAAILVLMGVIRQDWGSHKIQGATKERAQGAGWCRWVSTSGANKT